MNLQSIKDHLQRLYHQLGTPLRLGPGNYKLRGYFSNVMKNDPHHEPFMAKILQRILPSRAGAFIDVGVNVGQTLLKLIIVDPNRRYIGFEPQVGCCFLVDRFIKDNRLANARILPVALSNRNAILQLYSSEESFDSKASLTGRIEVDGGFRSGEMLIMTRIFDELIAELKETPIAMIKIDVEGAELEVLEGMPITLELQRPVIVFEVLPNFYGHDKKFQDPAVCLENTARADAIYKLLTAANYKILSIDELTAEETPIARFDLDDRTHYPGSNFIAYPADLLESSKSASM